MVKQEYKFTFPTPFAGQKNIKKPSDILVLDVGGTHIKILNSAHKNERKFDSGPNLTAKQMIAGVLELAQGWSFDAVSIGYPGPVLRGKPIAEPYELGGGWVGFDFEKALGAPVRMVNDAAMQAIGSYEGGEMLFLGLGTGLGSTMIVEGFVEPLELAHLPYKKKTYEDYVGKRGLHRLGVKHWRKAVSKVVDLLVNSLEPQYVVLGGGNAAKLETLPDKCRLGKNTNAFVGGFRMWSDITPPSAH